VRAMRSEPSTDAAIGIYLFFRAIRVQGARYSENLLEPTSGSCPWVLKEQAADFPPEGKHRTAQG
jgi:hypothetical protein